MAVTSSGPRFAALVKDKGQRWLKYQRDLCKALKLTPVKGSLHAMLKQQGKVNKAKGASNSHLSRFTDKELRKLAEDCECLGAYGTKGGLPPWTMFADVQEARWLDRIVVAPTGTMFLSALVIEI